MAECSKDLEAMVSHANLRKNGSRSGLSREASERTRGVSRDFLGVEKGFCF